MPFLSLSAIYVASEKTKKISYDVFHYHCSGSLRFTLSESIIGMSAFVMCAILCLAESKFTILKCCSQMNTIHNMLSTHSISF